MKIAIIGAGISGLTCAGLLKARGVDVVVFEKSRGLGGRIASRRIAETVVDHGTPQLPEVGNEAVRAILERERHVIGRPTGTLSGGVFVEDVASVRIGYPDGLTRIAKAMADGLSIRLSTRVAVLREASGRLEVGDEQGNTHGRFDAVVVTAPAPQAADLLDRSPEPAWRAEALRTVFYDPCVVVIAGTRIEEPTWFLARVEGGLVASIAVETAKGRQPLGGVVPIVARLTPSASATLLDSSDETVLAATLTVLASHLGPGLSAPAWTQVKRWRYSEPTSALGFDAINPAGTRIVVCGDTNGAGLLAAEESGRRAAMHALALA